ncbi:hypothetical protein EYC80_005936 [Monilinia laxa]|uniref:Uncharacterized protein n=1 Tax=Monilinia laxa TaxID=61186 RepID=A0A5N6KFW2_MONLA|nr:hypothetical protein EYC80_005936 [Monilinia laxa]
MSINSPSQPTSQGSHSISPSGSHQTTPHPIPSHAGPITSHPVASCYQRHLACSNPTQHPPYPSQPFPAPLLVSTRFKYLCSKLLLIISTQQSLDRLIIYTTIPAPGPVPAPTDNNLLDTHSYLLQIYNLLSQHHVPPPPSTGNCQTQPTQRRSIKNTHTHRAPRTPPLKSTHSTRTAHPKNPTAKATQKRHATITPAVHEKIDTNHHFPFPISHSHFPFPISHLAFPIPLLPFAKLAILPPSQPANHSNHPSNLHITTRRAKHEKSSTQVLARQGTLSTYIYIPQYAPTPKPTPTLHTTNPPTSTYISSPSPPLNVLVPISISISIPVSIPVLPSHPTNSISISLAGSIKESQPTRHSTIIIFHSSPSTSIWTSPSSPEHHQSTMLLKASLENNMVEEGGGGGGGECLNPKTKNMPVVSLN